MQLQDVQCSVDFRSFSKWTLSEHIFRVKRISHKNCPKFYCGQFSGQEMLCRSISNFYQGEMPSLSPPNREVQSGLPFQPQLIPHYEYQPHTLPRPKIKFITEVLLNFHAPSSYISCLRTVLRQHSKLATLIQPHFLPPLSNASVSH